MSLSPEESGGLTAVDSEEEGEIVSINGRRYTGLREKRVTPWKGE